MIVGFKGWAAAAALAALAGAPGASPPVAAEPPPEASEEFEFGPTMGAICVAALYYAIAEIGRRCVSDPDPAVQAELQASIARIDAYLLDRGWDRPALDRFKRDQGGADDPDSEFCAGDSVALYRAIAAAGPEKLKSASEKLVARPGRPVWGTCL